MELSQLNTNFNLADAQNPMVNGQRKAVNGSSNSLLSPEKQKIKEEKAAEDFEAMFVQMSLKQMRPKMEDGLFNSGLAEDVFYQFLDEAVAKEIARSPNNFGIADSVAKELPGY
jgi:Rod binding domain-containing protein